MLRRLLHIALFATSFGRLAQVDSPPAATRGKLLYATHCIACYDANIHWRDKRLVTGLKTLRTQVSHWQQVLGLGWGKEDVDEVAQYLQAIHHRELTASLTPN